MIYTMNTPCKFQYPPIQNGQEIEKPFPDFNGPTNKYSLQKQVKWEKNVALSVGKTSFHSLRNNFVNRRSSRNN